MPRQPRQFEINGIYHVLHRGVEKRNIFLKPQDYSRFILGLEFCNTPRPANLWSLIVGSDPTKFKQRLSEERKQKHNKIVDLLAFVLMPNHFHLIFQEIVGGGISLFMKKLGGYCIYFNLKWGQLYFLQIQKPNQKALQNERLPGVDPAELTSASLGVNSSMLLYTPRAQVYRLILKQKELSFKNSFCDTQF